MERQNAGRIRLGMVGGGRDAFIGGVHRMAARLDDQFELVAGCFSATAEKSQASGADLGLDPDRVYDDFADMAQREARLKQGIEAVAIVTPNHMHYPAAREFLKRGIHVICDKPLTAALPEAKRMLQAAQRSEALFILTHNYSGYPMVRQAREMVAAGELGQLRVVQVEYPQDWLTEALETRRALAPAAASAISAPMPITWRALSAGCSWRRSAPTCKASCRGGGSMTMPMCCCAMSAARAACCGRRRWHRAMKTRCGCGSMVTRAG